MSRPSGWPGLFWSAFKRSRNAMVLLDEERRYVDVNPAFVEMLGTRRSALIGHPVWEQVVDGPLMSTGEWRVTISKPEFSGIAALKRDGMTHVTVQFAGHPETVTGHRFVLVVALSTVHSRRRLAVAPATEEPLTEREREIVRLIGEGATGPEIARELGISHNTVRTHAHNAMNKLGARSRAHLVAKSLAEGHAAA